MTKIKWPTKKHRATDSKSIHSRLAINYDGMRTQVNYEDDHDGRLRTTLKRS